MNPIVSTLQGKVRGSYEEGVAAFKGIPYAAPQYGAHRFLTPQPVEPWSGVRDCLTFGPKSPQLPYPSPIDILVPELTGSGEDCLSLNIWSQDIGKSKMPVMVWIPGGMFEYHATGASPWYDGSRFARDGIVLVSINYRVGAEGFLYLDRSNANRGLLDQVAALTWVRENIAAFGGDPGNVTVFGESAGAISVGTLLAMPGCKGLFHRAITQSGAAHHGCSVESARHIREFLAEKLGVAATHEGFAIASTDRLLKAQAELSAELAAHPDPERWGTDIVNTMLPWQPVIDGEVLPARPIDLITAGAGADADLMVGTNTHEHRLFLVSGGLLDRVTEDALRDAIAAYGMPVESTLTSYHAAYPDAGAGDLLAAIQTDWYWRVPAIRMADAHVNASSATYMYEFAWRSPQFNGLLGACHSLEIPFTFDTLGRCTQMLWGPDPPQSLADCMHSNWVSFTTRGECSWPQYDLERRTTMTFNVAPEVVDDSRMRERLLWEGTR